ELFIFRLIPLEIVCFQCATGCEVFRIKIKNNPFSAVVFETDLLSLVRGEAEVWCRASNSWLISGRDCKSSDGHKDDRDEKRLDDCHSKNLRYFCKLGTLID